MALLVSAGLLCCLSAGLRAAARAPSGGQDLGSLSARMTPFVGTYGIHMEGTGPVPPPLGGGIQSLVGVVTRTYDGMGNFTQIDNIHGSVTGWVPDRPGSGTYQVNPDCTFATQFVPGPGAPVIEERGVIVDARQANYTPSTVTPMRSMVSALQPEN